MCSSRDRSVRLMRPERYAWLSVAAALATIALKMLAWWLTGSVGLLSDALESFVNLAAALLAVSMLRLAAAPPDEGHQYGHSKAEYFSAGTEGALIVLAAAGIFATGWLLLDPLIALTVAAYIIWTGVGLMRRSVSGLLDAAISRDEQNEITKLFTEYSRRFGISFHALRTRQAGARRFVSFHVLVPDAWTVAQAHQLCEEIEARVRSMVPHASVDTHIEPISDPASYEDQGLDR